jgi:hypothetical protein
MRRTGGPALIATGRDIDDLVDALDRAFAANALS